LTNRLSLTGGGRYNLAAIDMADLFGTIPDLSASYTFARFNLVTGLTYKILPELMTFYAGYSERRIRSRWLREPRFFVGPSIYTKLSQRSWIFLA
jgi:hypothetical protein